MLFQSGHRERFLAMGEKCNRAIEEAATCSAVYLLSADRFLCSRALAAIDQEGIHFSKIHIHGVDLDGYVLFHMARICIRKQSYSFIRTYRSRVGERPSI